MPKPPKVSVFLSGAPAVPTVRGWQYVIDIADRLTVWITEEILRNPKKILSFLLGSPPEVSFCQAPVLSFPKPSSVLGPKSVPS